MAINFEYNFPQLARDAGFRLRQYKDGPLDWRLIGSLEVERVLRDQSLEQIDGILSHLSEAPLGSILDTNILDSGIAKYFVLSQFSIQYLLFCRKLLDETVRELRESLVESQSEVGRLRKCLTEANNEVLQLNKKITQIEAIHEVVYPCHLCTKSFVSNEALNIHIGRKHGGAKGPERRVESPLSAQREKDYNDRNLINTIKLELEIKQLKERLNAAEKDIKERSTVNSRRPSPRIAVDRAATKDVAIQSNLIELKEKDDTISDHDESDAKDSVRIRDERKEQLIQLQDKIKDFESWRDSQAANNEESIAEINKKLADIAQALEASKREKVQDPPATNRAHLQRRVSPSVEDLEKLLSEKVAEIGRASAEKLEEVVFNMEQNYKDKLEELQREIKRSSQVMSTVREVQESRTKDTKVNQVGLNEKTESNSHERRTDETFDVEDFKAGESSKSTCQKNTETSQKRHAKELKESVSSESNRTFVKIERSTECIKDLAPAQAPVEKDDSTDVSETLSEESETETEHTSTDESDRPKSSKNQKPPKDTKAETDDKPTIKNNVKVEKPKISKPPTPIKVTRKDARKLTTQRLSTIGCNVNNKTISNARFNKTAAELSERRNQMKKTHPNFHATRNRIKKFVEKLCSTKLPQNAEDMLRKTQPQQPLTTDPKKHRNSASSQDDSFETLEPNASTPMKNDTSADMFKQKLERILGSPMRKPKAYNTATADVHSGPIPMPRKRVMFSTLSDENDSDDSEFQVDTGESKNVQITRHLKERGKTNVESSISSLL